MKLYPVYRVYADRREYVGEALIAAETLDEAQSFLRDFKNQDKDNKNDSWGYPNVTEKDLDPHLFSDEKGLIYPGIYYSG